MGWGQRGTEPELSGWAGPTLVEHIPETLPSLSRGSDPGSEGDEPPPLPIHFLLVGENTKKKKSPVTLKEAVISFSMLKEFLQFNCQTDKDLWLPLPSHTMQLPSPKARPVSQRESLVLFEPQFLCLWSGETWAETESFHQIGHPVHCTPSPAWRLNCYSR